LGFTKVGTPVVSDEDAQDQCTEFSATPISELEVTAMKNAIPARDAVDILSKAAGEQGK